MTLLFVSLATLSAASTEAQAATPKARLSQARLELTLAKVRLGSLRAAIRSAVAAGDKTQLKALAAQYHRLRAQIRSLSRRVARLRVLAFHPMTPGPNGSWWRVIEAAAARHRLDAKALKKMMVLESGGQSTAVSGPFRGLFQYCSGTWRAAWNPYKSYSIFNGGAQIWATATAIDRGWGRDMWPNTYPMAFGAAAR